MNRTRTAFFCTECGNETLRWQGQCPACGAWNTLVEEPLPAARRAGSGGRPSGGLAVAPASVESPKRLAEVDVHAAGRWTTGLAELDFVLGGGIVPGSVVLIGGEPGVGKSTLLLQAAARLEAHGRSVLYVSGEESAAQVRLRADRLGAEADRVTFLAETNLEAVLESAHEHSPAALFLDSIQTARTQDLDGVPGSVGQVRECAARLQRFAKAAGVAVVIVGHVTKEGAVAGPRTLEHIVDTVLYFESAGGLDQRILRATKNRFGASDEIGVFRMTGAGLEPVPNPSELFLGERNAGASGTAVLATVEGSRPLLVEVQALCSRSSFGAAQRVAHGFDRQRLALLLAVLEKRVGLGFAELDVFVNVVGGVRLVEPAGDAAVVAAVASSALDRPIPPDAVLFGEVGLGGELRSVTQVERRLSEAARMGFSRAFLPARAATARAPDGLAAVALPDIGTLVERLFR